MINFPTATAVGQKFTAPDGMTYVWQGDRWATEPTDFSAYATKVEEAARGQVVEVGAGHIIWQAPNSGQKIMHSFGGIQTGSDGVGSIVYPKQYLVAPTLVLTPGLTSGTHGASAHIYNDSVNGATIVTIIIPYAGGPSPNSPLGCYWTAIGFVA